MMDRSLFSSRNKCLVHSIIGAVSVSMILCCSPSNGGQSEVSGQLSIDTLLDIRHPSHPCWGPDNRRIAFIWDRGGVQNIWISDTSSGSLSALTRYDDGLIQGLFWGQDGKEVYFERGGDLWRVSPSGGEAEPVWSTPEGEGAVVLSPEGGRVAFVRDGDLWVRSLVDDTERRLTETSAAESGPIWSPDGARIVFTFSRVTPDLAVFDYVGAKVGFRRFESTPPDVAVVSAAGGPVTTLAPGPGLEGTPRWIDDGRISIQRVSTDYKTREILAVDVVTGDVHTLHEDVDEKWWSLGFLGAEPKPSPDGRWVAFISDRDGRDHLYVVSSDGGDLHSITRGDQDVRRPAWSPDGSRIAFDTNEAERPGRRHLRVAEVGANPQSDRFVPLTRGPGTNTQPTNASGFVLTRARGGWSPDGTRIVYQHTDPTNPADLFWLEVDSEQGSDEPHRLTDSMPEGVARSALVEPELVWYPAADGKEVPAYLFVPRGLDSSRQHPAIVWIHGDGIAQNYEGWHVRRDYAVYYSFHQYLVQKGYVVLAPDYRGSVGYGRAWRVEPYMDVGGKDYKDVASGTDYLRSLGYVDMERIGVWGLSYGGYFTLQALTLDPELFRCGVNVAGVQDFRDWYKDPGGSWIAGRMGSPAENPEGYRRSAPIERIDRIVRPLMVLHGTADVNVPFLESVRLVDELLDEDKQVEFMMYPGEYHYFHRRHVLRDAWWRVDRFFDTHLRATGE